MAFLSSKKEMLGLLIRQGSGRAARQLLSVWQSLSYKQQVPFLKFEGKPWYVEFQQG
jgi:hypothetical protein